MRKPSYKVDFAHLKRVVPLTSILSRYGLDAWNRVGAQLKGPCPIHKGSNKRQFVIDPRSNSWRCFGDCNRGGGSLEFVAEMEHVGIKHAAQLIAEWFAVLPLERAASQTKRRTSMSGERPSHKVFVVEDRGENEDDAFWTRVGSAWPHKDGKGLNVQLASGVAVSGRVVLREMSEEDAKADEDKHKKAKRK